MNLKETELYYVVSRNVVKKYHSSPVVLIDSIKHALGLMPVLSQLIFREYTDRLSLLTHLYVMIHPRTRLVLNAK